MFSLVYKSKARISLTRSQIQELLFHCRNFNEKNNITGCLLYYQGEFLQYLEGNEDLILNLFERIKIDVRHQEVQLLSYDHISSRVFENWDMGYEDFLGTNHQLEYLKLYVSLFVRIPKEAIDTSRSTSDSFWKMVKKLITPESIDK